MFHKKEKNARSLELKFTIEDERLKCVVRDNGVGRRKANQKKAKSHNSKGLTMMQERIDYLNLAYETKKFSHHISDVFNEDGEVMGTQVILYIPTILN